MKKMTNLTLLASTLAVLSSSPALADLKYETWWPYVKCKKDGKKFQYNPTKNGVPSYATAANKCAAYGGVDIGPAIIGPRPRDTPTKKN